MTRTADGCHEVLVENVRQGAKYKFSLNGRDVPDPYARFLPDGVHGSAMVLEPRYKWRHDNVTAGRRVGSHNSCLVALGDAAEQAPQPAALSPPGLAGMFDERCELLAERRGVLLAQIDLILGAIHLEPHRLVCRTAIKIILEFDGYLLCHPGLPCAAIG